MIGLSLTRRAKRVFEGALGLSEADRQEWALGECGDDPELHAEVPVAVRVGADGSLVRDSGVPPRDNFWRPDHGFKRFIQFSFERQWFCMDMPRSTLFKPEAERIMRNRSGFFYLRDLPQFTLYEEDTEGHDPFRKIYLYGDEHTAAEDGGRQPAGAWVAPGEVRQVSSHRRGVEHERNEVHEN